MKRVLPIAAVSVFAATLGMYFRAPSFLTNGPPAMTRLWPVRALCHWDCWWYSDIATTGYWYRPGEQSPVAYFPAFPMLIRAVNFALGDVWLSGVVVSLGCGIAGAVLFSKWAKTVAPAHANTAALALAVYPLAVYLYGIVYSDGLFLLLVVGAFFALEKDRIVLATVLGICATAGRPVAPAVVLGLLARSLELGRTPRHFLPALACLGLLGWMLFLHLQFGDALAFVHVESAPGWEHTPGPHAWFKLAFFELLTTTPKRAILLGIHGALALSALALSWQVKKRLGIGYALYVLCVVGIPTLASKDFQGLGRYVLAAFPVWIPIAVFLDQRPKVRTAWLAASALGLICCAVLFGSDFYLA